MDKDSLYVQLNQKEKQFEKNKLKRVIVAISFIAIVIFIILFKMREVNSITDVLIMAIFSVVGAGIYFFINSLIFIPLFTRSSEENKILEELEKKCSELDNNN